MRVKNLIIVYENGERYQGGVTRSFEVSFCGAFAQICSRDKTTNFALPASKLGHMTWDWESE